MKGTELIYHLLYVALTILRDNSGTMRVSALLREVGKREGNKIGEEYRQPRAGGLPRWDKILRFYSIRFSDVGLLKKSKGIWYLTPDGEAKISRLTERGVINFVKTEFAELQKRRAPWPEGGKVAVQPAEEENVDKEVDESPDLSLDDFEERARDGITEQVRKLSPGELEQLVAALLRGMGYYTPIVASGGPDGGVDVVAYRDPLGATTPRLKVQVKHQMLSAKKAARRELQALNGLLTEGESGVFVATAGFAPTVREFVRTTNNHLELIDMDRLIDLWREHYDALSDEDKALLPLRRISFLDGERVRNL